MAFDPDLEEQELLAAALERAGSRMAGRELVMSLLSGLGYVAAAAALWVAAPPDYLDVLPAALCCVVLVLATSVHFDTPFGFTVPTQLAFVPLLFTMSPAAVPLAVVAALLIARLPEAVSGRAPASRLLQIPANAWFAIGPPAVFIAAGTEPWRSGSALLLAALAAQVVLDFAVSSLRYAIGVGARLGSQLSEAWVYAVDAGLAGLGLVIAQSERATPAAVLSIIPLLMLFALLAHERHDRLESLIELNNAYRGTALVLGDVVKADDGYTGEHSRGVVRLALEVGSRLPLDAAQRRNLEFGALLHDIGKIAIPKEIINKPGKLDPAEWTLVRTHTLEGQQMLDRVGGFMREVGLVVRSHHERWDGHGYPDHLAGEEIPIEARIVTCCDSWNAMRTDRVYRRALSHEDAVAEIIANAGTQFDPAVAEALLDVVARPAAPRSSPPAALAAH